MRALIVGVDADGYGSAVSMVELAERLRELGNDIICVIPGRGKTEALLQLSKIPYKIIAVRKWIYDPEEGRVLFWIRRLYRAILNLIAELRLFFVCRTNKIDLIHLNSCTSPCGSLCAKILHLKLIWHIREFVEEDFGKRFYQKKRAMRRIGESDAVIAVSRAISEKYSQYISTEKIHVIYNGVSDEFGRLDREIFVGKKTIISHIGRICENKGQRELLESCRLLKEAGLAEDIQVWIVGSGEKKYVDLLKTEFGDLQDFVVFKGYCSDINKILEITDIVVVNSKCEAFGRVTAEAMLSGKLVIGSNKGCTPELLEGGCGLLYESGDSEALCRVLQEALGHTDEMRQVAHQGREKARKYYTSLINAEHVNELYREIMEG